VTLKVWSWQSDLGPKWEKVFSVYEQDNPGIKVEFKGYPSTEYPTVLRTGLSGPDGPDIVMQHPYNSLLPYVKAGQLDPLDPKSIPELGNFNELSLAAARFGGKLYGVPFAQQTMTVFYNKKIFAEHGLTPPDRPDQVQTMLDKLRSAGVTPYAVTGKDSWQLVNVFDALVGNTYGGGDFIARVQRGEAKWTDPAFVRALTEFKSLQSSFPKNVAGVGYTDSKALFNAGRAAMFPGGSWELGGFRTAKPSVDLGVFSMPAAGETKAPTWGYEDGSLSLSAKSRHKEAATKLLRWMATPAFGQQFTDTLAQSSSVKGVRATDPLLAQMIADHAANPVPMIWVTDYFGVQEPAPYAALMNALQNLLLGKTDPAAAAVAVQASSQEWAKQQAAN
jgi:raffinose/stachyose/melibiose transport system substrate-binding protein